MSPLHRRGHELMVQDRWQGHRLVVGSISYNEYRELLEDVVENLEYLTIDIDAPHLDDFSW